MSTNKASNPTQTHTKPWSGQESASTKEHVFQTWWLLLPVPQRCVVVIIGYSLSPRYVVIAVVVPGAAGTSVVAGVRTSSLGLRVHRLQSLLNRKTIILEQRVRLQTTVSNYLMNLLTNFKTVFCKLSLQTNLTPKHVNLLLLIR